MAKIYLFGSSTISSLTPQIEGYLATLYAQGHEFIVGDGRGADSAFHVSLSRIGALDRTTVYCMDKAKNNKYDIKERIFNTAYDSDAKKAIIIDAETNEELFVIDDVEQAEDIPGTRAYYEFKNRFMVNECAIAICLWDGESKGTLFTVQLLGMRDKPCYTYKF